MGRVAIVADSACDLPASEATAIGVRLVPQLVVFGDREYRSGTELAPDAFWDLLTAPDAPFPRTAAPSPAAFEAAFRAELDAGASAVVCVCVGSKLSATVQSATIAGAAFPKADVQVFDSMVASEGEGLLVRLAAEMAAAGCPAAAIIDEITAARDAAGLFAALDTLEYLRRGGRISPAQAAIGSVLSVKPIITITDGRVETVDKPRTRSRARARLLELLCRRPIDRIVVMHARAPDALLFADELAERAEVPREQVRVELFGPAIGAHIGPGGYGAGVLYRR